MSLLPWWEISISGHQLARVALSDQGGQSRSLNADSRGPRLKMSSKSRSISLLKRRINENGLAPAGRYRSGAEDCEGVMLCCFPCSRPGPFEAVCGCCCAMTCLLLGSRHEQGRPPWQGPGAC